MADALLYYSHQVVASELRDRLFRLKEKKDAERKENDKVCQVTWKEAKSLFLQYMEKPMHG